MPVRRRAGSPSKPKQLSPPKDPHTTPSLIIKNKLLLFILALLSFVVATYVYVINVPKFPEKLIPNIEFNISRDSWGTFRSHTYFGLRKKDPKSMLFGLMWYEQPYNQRFPGFRHWCDQGHNLKRYGWYEADGRSFGRQNISDHHADLMVDWFGNGDAFNVRVKVLTTKRIVLIPYFVSQDSTVFSFGKGMKDMIHVDGPSPGTFKIHISDQAKVAHSTLLHDGKMDLTRLDDFIVHHTRILNEKNGDMVFVVEQIQPFKSGNFAAIQLTLPHANSEIHFVYSTPQNEAIAPKSFNSHLSTLSQKFHERFDKTFKVNKEAVGKDAYEMTKYSLANMIGSIGYWYGSNKVDFHGVMKSYGPHELISAVPSRPFFPRGFLWDEGFHNMLIAKFDPAISIEILISWLNTMNTHGWMAREQILGVESEAKVPVEYIAQKMDLANPPSLFLVIDELIQDPKVVAQYKDEFGLIYKKLIRWFRWLVFSQDGPTPTTFRWRGRNATTNTELNPKTMASGLDDYPRASHPSKDEYHLDLRCWITLTSKVLKNLANLFGTNVERVEYAAFAAQFVYDDLVKHHWDESAKQFSDFGLHSTSVHLKKQPVKGNPLMFEVVRHVGVKPEKMLVSDVFGYNSLYPLMFRLIPVDSPHLKIILTKLRDRKVLWTDFGLRSLSRNSPYYNERNTEHDPPYWRGNIWINMNYLVLHGLQHYAETTGPYQALSKEIYLELRRNVVENMQNEFRRTGYIYEHYNADTGKGGGTYPFTGWSSLILLALENYSAKESAN